MLSPLKKYDCQLGQDGLIPYANQSTSISIGLFEVILNVNPSLSINIWVDNVENLIYKIHLAD